MMAEKRKIYTAEFKREAVRLVTEHHYGVAETARNLGINTNMLRRWKRELADCDNGAFPGKGRLSPEQEELHRLRAENKRLRMEREILKKAAAFFANESNCGTPLWSSINSNGPSQSSARCSRAAGVGFMPMCTGTRGREEILQRRPSWRG
jgi:transposase